MINLSFTKWKPLSFQNIKVVYVNTDLKLLNFIFDDYLVLRPVQGEPTCPPYPTRDKSVRKWTDGLMDYLVKQMLSNYYFWHAAIKFVII